MIQMTALKPIKISGRMVSAGEGFSVKGKSEARLLTAMGRAEIAKAEGPKPTVKRVAAIFTPAEPEPKKRAYKRRDMTAEGSTE